MSAIVLNIRPKERPQQNLEHIAAVYRNLDSRDAEKVVSRALGELGLTLSSLASQMACLHRRDTARELKRLERMAENLGLITLSQVAKDLAYCLELGDSTAFAAVWARLLRLGQCTMIPEEFG